MKLRIHELAGKELHEAIQWYNQLQEGLGKQFQQMVLIQVDKIKKNPEWFPQESKGIFKANKNIWPCPTDHHEN